MKKESAASSQLSASLEWLIHPVSKEMFFAEYWEKKPLVVKRNQPDYFSGLSSLDEIDRALTTLDLRHPNVTLKNADRPVTADDYTVRGGALDVAKVYQLFAEGSTITLAFLDTVLPALTAFCRGLEREFSCPLQANAYLTPPNAKGAKHHFDSHDVFVLQIVNSKHWTTYGTPVELPLRDQDFDPAIHAQGAPTLDFELEAGDVVYIPRGVVHDARSGDKVSLHITAGILGHSWKDFLLEFAADAALNDVAFRKALPPGFASNYFDRADARRLFLDLLQRLPDQANFDVVLDRFVDKFISACPPMLQGQMQQLEKLDGVTIDSTAGARPSVIIRIEEGRDSIFVDCFGRRITFPLHVSEALRFALESPRFVVRELPGRLDDPGKMTLVRRLVREGLVQILSV